jgi:hypothetical protein
MTNLYLGSHTASWSIGFVGGMIFTLGMQMMLHHKQKRAFARTLRRSIRAEIQHQQKPGGLLARKVSDD